MVDYNTISDADFEAHVRKTEFHGKIGSALSFSAAVHEELKNGTVCRGSRLPWVRTHGDIGIRPGEVSIWAGINGHGKSMLLGQVIAWMAREEKCLIASMEMRPASTLSRMVLQITGAGDPAHQYIDRVLEYLGDKLWVYDHVDTVSYDKIYRMISYAAEVLGIKHVMVDSLAMCGIATDDTNGQKDFVLELENLAKNYQIHIHLVHHIRKKENEYTMPDKFDVKGAGELVDLADNLFIVFRNKKKEDKVRAGETPPQDYQSWDDMPDAYLVCAKQRHHPWEGRIPLWFDLPSRQYKGSNDTRRLDYGYGL